MKINLNVVNPPPLFIVFCLTGDKFPAEFFDSFLDLMAYCHQRRIRFMVVRRNSPVVYFVRNSCLGGEVMRGVDQKPFNSTLNYTHIMWIDRDISFKPEQFQTLLDLNQDIVSGVYKMLDNIHYAVVEKWDEVYFEKHGTFKFLTDDDMKKNDYTLIDVDYTGLGFMLVKRGVFESLPYPWFRPIFYKIGNCVDFCSEDVGFCRSIKEKGYKIYIDPRVRVGHLKEVKL